jgi:hypothetical protein
VGRDGCPYALDPEVWRGLLARACCLWAARARLEQLNSLSHVTEVQSALSGLNLKAKEAARARDDNGTAVRQTADRWRDQLMTLINGLPGDLPAGADAARAKAVLDKVYELCATAADEDPIRNLFDVLECGARKTYEAVYTGAWRQATLSLSALPALPYAEGGQHPYGIAASCDVAEAMVELHIFPDGLGPAAFAALPRLISHECVCHVAARQTDNISISTSVFAEGFMDWTAKTLFEDVWIDALDCDFAPAAKQHARQIEEFLAPRLTRGGATRRAGWRAADTAVAWYANAAPTPSSAARIAVAILAVHLNTVEAPLRKKNDLVERLEDNPYEQPFADLLKATLKDPSRAADLLDAAA